MKISIFGASDATTAATPSPAKAAELQEPKAEEKVDEAAEEARGGEEPTVEKKEEEDQREKEEPPREEDVVEDKKEEDDADPRTSTLTGSATASLTADGKSTYLAFLEESHKNGGPSTAGRGRKKSAATGSRRSASSRSSRSRSRSTRRSRSRSTRQGKRSMSKNNKAKKETAPSPPAKEAEAPKEERRSRSLSPRKLVGSFRKSKKDQTPPPPSSSSSTKEVIMPDMTTADGKSAYLAYLEANHMASVGGSKKNRSSSRSRSRSRPQKSATTEKPKRRSLSRPRKSATTAEKAEKPKRRSLSPRRRSNRIYAQPSPKATKKDLPPADKQSAVAASVSAPAVVDGKSEYLAFLEANHKMGSSGKKPSGGGGGGSKRNLFRSKSKRSSARSVPVDTGAVEEATTKKNADAPVYVETEAVNLDDGTKKGIACDESQPPTDDSFVEPEELKDVAIANMDTPVLSNIAEAATDDETTSAPSTAEVEQETELTKSGFFDNLLDCTSMGFCLASSKSPTTVISEDLMPAEDK
mmetsp:Transcript_52536/g.127250  ORF Transcript_52536/g.127250 Transcript_52536/m.127250 type:complete len:526 (-) Transcript_52536:1240-2817(-)